MKSIKYIIVAASFLYGCGNNNGTSENEFNADPNDKQKFSELKDGEGDYYEFSGSAPERKNSFDKASSELENNIRKLKNSTTDNDIIEKLDEVQEKIDEAREITINADEKIAENKYDDANEKIEDAREKLEEAREKYLEVLEKINNVN